MMIEKYNHGKDKCSGLSKSNERFVDGVHDFFEFQKRVT
jgi:hypothetical protein